MQSINWRNCIAGIVVLMLLANSLAAQGVDPLKTVSIASPNAASLGKYADIPVSYHTGIPQIEIPIYTIKEGPLSLPIGISYHAGGLKVMEAASSVGAGWALNAGGVITRSVAGAPDDRGINGALTQYGHYSDYGFNNYLFVPCSQGQPGGCTMDGKTPDDNSIASGVKDGEPDLYFFNFNGYAGKFYFRDDRTPVLLPEQDLKIQPLFTDGTTSTYLGMYGFIITTPDGTAYMFGKNQSGDGNPDAVEITTSITHVGANTQQGAVSAWYLNKITSADGQFSIKLNYAAEKLSYYTLAMFPIWSANQPGLFNSQVEYDYVKNFINGVRLSSIVCSSGEVDFLPGDVRTDVGDYNSQVIGDVANTTARTLGAIQITNNHGYCKKHNFSYSYFVDNTSPLNGIYGQSGTTSSIQSDRYRLRLDKLTETSCDGTVALPPHVFTYFSELVPRKLTFGQDHWGFYNGINNSTGLVPTYTENNLPKAGADRDAHWPAMRGGALQKITYPAGGSATFDYEANDTYATTSTQALTSRFNMSVGYDGSGTPQNYTTTLSGNVYWAIVSNANGGGTGFLNLYDITNARYVSVPSFGNVNPGKTDTEYFSVPAGNYRFTLNKNSPMSGYGITASISEWVPTTVHDNLMIGGLRIKTITHNDGTGAANVVTNYDYRPGGQSSGILYSRPVYVQLLYNSLYAKYAGVYTSGFSGGAYYKSGATLAALSTTQGNHIGYNEVKVSQTGNGYSIYRYYGSAVWDTYAGDIVTRAVNTQASSVGMPDFPSAPAPFDYMRGELKYEGHYNESGQVLEDTYYYPVYVQQPMTTPGLMCKIISMTGGASVFWGTEYTWQTSKKTQLTTTKTMYNPAAGTSLSVTNTLNFASNYHHQVTQKTTTSSQNENLVTNIKYAPDYAVGTSIDDCSASYYSAMSAATANFSSASASCGTDYSCLRNKYFQYRRDKSLARINYISCRRTNFTDAVNAYTAAHNNAKANANADLKPILELQDRFIIAPIETQTWRDASVTDATLTRYAYPADGTASVYPSRFQSLHLAAPSASITTSAIGSDNVSMLYDSRYGDDLGTNYYNSNLTEIQKVNDTKTTYLWGYSCQYPVAKITGTDYNTAKQYITQSLLDNAASYTDGQVRTELNKLRTNLPNALVTTYTYSPLLGMTSETDPSGKTMYYEYDGVGRLKLVRDKDKNIVKQYNYFLYNGQ